MNHLRKFALVGVAIGQIACGAGSELDVYGGEGSDIDTERSQDPEFQAEQELRSNPLYDPVFANASREYGVPTAVLKGLAWAQTRYEMVQGESEFEGRPAAFGMMALAGENLTRGAELAGVTLDEAKLDATANVRATAALLSAWADEAGIDKSQAAAWAPMLARLSGTDLAEAQEEFVRDGVFGALKLGVGQPSDELKSTGQSLEVDSGEFGAVAQELSAGPDYAPAVWRPSPNYSSRSHKVSHIIIHTCEGAYSGCWGWLANSKSGVSAHYVVNESGSQISQLVRESQKAWHIGSNYSCSLNGGTSCGLNGVNSNNFTVGIEHGGFASQASWSSGLIEASSKLSCDITKGHGIPRTRNYIVGHGQLQPATRTDPGRNWPWATYMSRINAHCGVTPPKDPVDPPSNPGGSIVVDSNNANNDKSKGYIKVSANWTGTASTGGFYGSGYYFAGTKAVSDGAEFWFYLPAAATKTVDAWWTAGTNRSNVAPFVAFNAQGAKVGSATANQTANGGKWNQIGRFNFSAGWNKIVLSRWAPEGKVVIGDAVRIR